MKASIILLPLLFVLSFGKKKEKPERWPQDWWEKTIFYQIYPRSFADSNGDGIGDIKGITSKLDHFKDLNIGAVWISPIFESPMYDFGYDISNFYAIHHEYGTMEDFDGMMARAKELDIKIVLDLVPNHTSNESMWFQEALKGNKTYYDYFVWEDPKIDENGNRHPPNNWLSHFRGSAWTYREEVGKYYFHQFVPGQPELNYRNPAVKEEIKKIIRFWCNKGVAGFRVDAAKYLYEVDKSKFGGKFPDEPLSGKIGADPESFDYLTHIYTSDLDETYDLIYEWRQVFDEYNEIDGMTRVMMTEVYSSIKMVQRYFGDGKKKGAHVPFNFDLVSDVNSSSSAADIKRAVDKFMTYKPVNEGANWVVGNHDNPRMATKYGPSLVDGINMLVTLLPGVACSYQGEEIGMVDGYVSWEDTVDPFGRNAGKDLYQTTSRDPERTPFQWNAEKNAGFSTADKTWLPVAQNYKTLNVEAQKAAAKSHYKVYQALARLRQKPAFRYGRYESVAMNDDVFVFKRWLNCRTYLVLINMRNVEHTIDLTYFENVVGDVSVVLSSIQSPKKIGDIYDASCLPVAGYEGLVLKLKK